MQVNYRAMYKGTAAINVIGISRGQGCCTE